MFGKRSQADNHTAVAAPSPQPAPAAAQPQSAAPPPAPRPAASQGVIEGGRAPIPSNGLGAQLVPAPSADKRQGGPNGPSPSLVPTATDSRHSEAYYETKGTIFGALIEAIDLAQLAKLDAESARGEIRDIINEIIAIKAIIMSIAEQEELLDDICNDVLGYGPLQPLLARGDIATSW